MNSKKRMRLHVHDYRNNELIEGDIMLNEYNGDRCEIRLSLEDNNFKVYSKDKKECDLTTWILYGNLKKYRKIGSVYENFEME